jgi:hypothetical protein
MNAKTTQTFENLSLRSVTDRVSSLRSMLPVPGAFHGRSMRFGDPLALPAVGFLHRIGA